MYPVMTVTTPVVSPIKDSNFLNTPVRQSPRISAKRKLADDALHFSPKRVSVINTFASQDATLESRPSCSGLSDGSDLVKEKICFPQFSSKFPKEGNFAYARIDVKSAMKEKKEHADLVKCLRNGLLSSKQREIVCKILLTSLNAAIKSWYPHVEAKIQLKDIVHAWPKMASTVGDPWSAFSCPNGHLDMALRTLRKENGATLSKIKPAGSSSPKLNVAPSASTTTSSESTFDEDLTIEAQIEIRSLAALEETFENRPEIIRGMEKYSSMRRKMVKNGKSVNEILGYFPKLISFEGALIEADFVNEMGNCGKSFVGTFQMLYIQPILCHAKKFAPKLMEGLAEFGDDELKAVLALVALVPKFPKQSSGKGKSASNAKKGKGSLRGGIVINPPNMKVEKYAVPHPALLQVVQTNVDVDKYESKFWRTDVSANPNHPKRVQPYVLFSSDDKATGTYYLKANDLTIPVGSSSLKAFTLLLKYHYVFDVGFDSDLLHFFAFLGYLYSISGCSLTTTMQEFLSQLRNAGSAK